MNVVLSALLALSVSASDAPYVRSRTSTTSATAHCLWWPSASITFQQSNAGNADTTAESEFTAVSRSFQTWEEGAASCSGLDFTEGPRTQSRDIGFSASSAGNQNVVMFRTRKCATVAPSTAPCWTEGDCGNVYDCWAYQDGTIALTTTTFDTNTGRVYDADIELNAETFEFTTVDAPKCIATVRGQSCVSTDVQNTMTHEIGHMLGLDHTTREGSTMHPNAVEGETSKRSLDEGTLSFTCDVFPKGAGPRDCNAAGEPVPVPCSAFASGSAPADCDRTGGDGDGDSGGCAAAPGTMLAFAALALGGLWPLLRRRRA